MQKNLAWIKEQFSKILRVLEGSKPPQSRLSLPQIGDLHTTGQPGFLDGLFQ